MSMMRRVAVAFAVFFLCTPLHAEESHQLDRIVVTPSRLSVDEGDSGRSVTVLDTETIGISAYEAIQDMIGSLGGIDIRRRGANGVQSDVNIRGATFEQNTVLLDGIKLNDPQTGHYTMDLPLTAFDLEQVEILKGPASSLYGADSFGGVINLITKKPEHKRELAMNATGGTQDYFSQGISVSYPFAAAANRFSMEWTRSSAYIPDTAFDIINLSESTIIDTPCGESDFFFGYSYKDFGAASFYSNLFPREAEITDTRFFKLSHKFKEGSLAFNPRIFLRRHYDKFALDNTRPGWQTNYHTNYTYGADLAFTVENPFMDAAYGLELGEDRIFSTNLGKHSRTRTGLYAEISAHIIERLRLNAGIRQDTFSGFDTEYSPSVNARYFIFDFLSLRSSVVRSYRIPTFTDLYYADAGNIGNPDLGSESSWTYEAGIDYDALFAKCRAGYFRRESSDTIDWTRYSSNQPWRANNIGSVNTNGAEASIEIRPGKLGGDFSVDKILVDYTVLDIFNKHDYLSKYALDYLKQHITFGVEYSLFGFTNSWVLNYKKRVGFRSYVVVDAKLTKRIIKKDNLTFEGFIEATNLFDTDYSEQSGVPMPGRQIKSGVKLVF